MAIWAKGGKKDVVVLSKSVETVKAIEGKYKILSRTGGPAATKKA